MLKQQPGRGRRRSGAMRQLILDGAIKLFAKDGYATTSMSAIARAAGIDQSSLYYWFGSKEDILKEILESNQTSTRVAAQLGSYPHEKPLQLYTVLYTDLLMLANIPFDYYELETIAYEQPESFAPFFVDYRTLFDHLRQIIDDGIADGAFKLVDSVGAAMAAMALNEGMQHRFRCQAITGGSEKRSATEFANLAASTTLNNLLIQGDATDFEAPAQGRNWL